MFEAGLPFMLPPSVTSPVAEIRISRLCRTVVPADEKSYTTSASLSSNSTAHAVAQKSIKHTQTAKTFFINRQTLLHFDHPILPSNHGRGKENVKKELRNVIFGGGEFCGGNLSFWQKERFPPRPPPKKATYAVRPSEGGADGGGTGSVMILFCASDLISGAGFRGKRAPVRAATVRWTYGRRENR